MPEKRKPYKEGPLISVDVSKSSVTYQAWIGFRDPYCKPRKAKMSRSGQNGQPRLLDHSGMLLHEREGRGPRRPLGL